MIGLHLNAAFHLAKRLLPALIKGTRPSVTFVGSVAGLVAWEGDVAYNVAKAGLHHLARCIAADYAKQGLRANAVAPGVIDTPLTRGYAAGMTEMGKRWLVFLGVAFVPALLIVAPITSFLVLSLYRAEKNLIVREITFGNYANFFGNWTYFGTFLGTVLLCLEVMGAAVLIGYPVAWFIWQQKGSRRYLLLLLAVMLESLERGDFYILCPDNEATRDLDEKRIAWAAGDIIENRPPLSRWHPDYGDRFAAFVKQGKNR